MDLKVIVARIAESEPTSAICLSCGDVWQQPPSMTELEQHAGQDAGHVVRLTREVHDVLTFGSQVWAREVGRPGPLTGNGGAQ